MLPLTLLTHPDAQGTIALRRAAALRGNSGFSLVNPGVVGLTPWVDAAWRQGPFRLGVDGRVPLAAQLSEERTRRVDAVVQLSGVVGLEVHPNVLLGSTFQAIYVATAPADTDATFLALIPSVRVHGGSAFAEARLTLNLDAPLGFAFSPDGVWALGLAVGTTF